MNKIVHLTRSEINLLKWDKCISSAFNGIVYGYSWYLDTVSEGWEALVEGDYERVMPLTQKQKYNIPYLAQPPFCQQTGIFSATKLNNEIINNFLDAIPEKYKLIEIQLNKYNLVNHSQFKVSEGITYELDLSPSYYVLNQYFSTNTIRNIKKALQSELEIVKGVAPNDALELLRNSDDRRRKLLKEHHFSMLRRLMTFSLQHRFGEIYGIYGGEGHQLCASAFFIQSHNRVIYLNAVSNEFGKKSCAMFLLIDTFLQHNTEKNLTLDFEGSKVEGIARFYASFGAKPYIYPCIKQNHLAWYLRIFKK